MGIVDKYSLISLKVHQELALWCPSLTFLSRWQKRTSRVEVRASFKPFSLTTYAHQFLVGKSDIYPMVVWNFTTEMSIMVFFQVSQFSLAI